MLIVLLIFSLCLHFVAFYLITILVQRMNQIKTGYNETSDEPVKMLMEQYLEDIRQENEALIEQIKKVQETRSSKESSPDSKGNRTTVQNVSNTKRKEYKPELLLNDEDILPKDELINQVEDQAEQSDQAKILQLFHKGFDLEEIAKQLNLGKGEVELTINIHNKKQN